METKLARIAEVARTNPKERFTSLVHLINEEMLLYCHQSMQKKKAPGIDKTTKMKYEENLEANIKDLLGRMKRQAYKPQSVKRVYIPKPGTSKKRPLGIPAYEDKLVQASLARILNAIYEQDFLECSFGFRPGRSCHDALRVLNRIVNKDEIKYVVDVDIQGFFDNVDHEWLMKFIRHRIGDPNVHRLIVRFLKAGISDAGIKYDTPHGTPQGGVISPILANIYLHYVVDLWFEKKIRKQCRGLSYMIRYADDMVFCFQNKTEAYAFYEALQIRLKEFKLELSKEKSNIFMIKEDKNDDNNGSLMKVESFDFLGFTHYWGKSRNGQKRIRRKTSKAKYSASIKRCKEWIKRNRTMPTEMIMKKIKLKIQGHINYFGVTDNYNSVNNFVDAVRTLIFKWLNRRSQRRSFDWGRFILFMKKYPLPKPMIKVNLFEYGVGISYGK